MPRYIAQLYLYHAFVELAFDVVDSRDAKLLEASSFCELPRSLLMTFAMTWEIYLRITLQYGLSSTGRSQRPIHPRPCCSLLWWFKERKENLHSRVRCVLS